MENSMLISYHFDHPQESKRVHCSDTEQETDTDSESRTGKSLLHSAKALGLHNLLLKGRKKGLKFFFYFKDIERFWENASEAQF